MNRLFSSVLCLFVCCGVISGCGGSERPRVYKATGAVLLDDKPLEGAIVAFQPVVDAKAKYQRPSSAITDAGGKFSPQTYGTNDGLPAGKYKVGVQKREVVGKPPANSDSDMPGAVNMKFKLIVPRVYEDPSQSGLEVEVTSSGMKPDVLKLKSAATPEMELTGPQRRANEP